MPCEICGETSKFGYKGVKPGIRCSGHKLTGMINVYQKTCIIPECLVQANFSLGPGMEKIYCSPHGKKYGAISERIRNCITCLLDKKYKTGNYSNEKGERFCFIHKPKIFTYLGDRMICKGKECSTIASYGYQDGESEYCVHHKTVDMISLVGPFCEICGEKSSYGYVDSKERLRCVNCKTDDMIYNDF